MTPREAVRMADAAGRMVVVMNDLTRQAVKLGKSIEELRKDIEWRTHWYRDPGSAWWDRS